MACIRIQTEDGTQIHQIVGILLVGRGEEADILLLDGAVSRRHARIYGGQGNYFVTDLGSSNGILVNGTKAMTTRLQHGDEIQIGSNKMVFSEDGSIPAKEEIIMIETFDQDSDLEPYATNQATRVVEPLKD